MKSVFCILLFLLLFNPVFPQQLKIRKQADTYGYAGNSMQMDSVMSRISREKNSFSFLFGNGEKLSESTIFRLVICPHDDYAYAGRMYPLVLKNIKAKTVIIFGVAHKQKLRDRLVFEDYNYWKSAYGNVEISPLRELVLKGLSKEYYLVDDSIHAKEHSVEGIVPFLQFYNRKVEILPVLVPNMPLDSMQLIAKNLAEVLYAIMTSQNLKWGEDIAIVVSNDAVHYGDEDWGGKNYAFFGNDSAAYKEALLNEKRLVQEYLIPEYNFSKIASFVGELVDANSVYKWTWCGRNTIPFGLLTAMYLQEKLGAKKLTGSFLAYSTSIMNKPLKLDDLKMGSTAPASIHHWVGYAAIGYQ